MIAWLWIVVPALGLLDLALAFATGGTHPLSSVRTENLLTFFDQTIECAAFASGLGGWWLLRRDVWLSIEPAPMVVFIVSGLFAAYLGTRMLRGSLLAARLIPWLLGASCLLAFYCLYRSTLLAMEVLLLVPLLAGVAVGVAWYLTRTARALSGSEPLRNGSSTSQDAQPTPTWSSRLALLGSALLLIGLYQAFYREGVLVTHPPERLAPVYDYSRGLVAKRKFYALLCEEYQQLSRDERQPGQPGAVLAAAQNLAMVRASLALWGSCAFIGLGMIVVATLSNRRNDRPGAPRVPAPAAMSPSG